ncbi:formate dehydrogenase subunit delta [Pseudomonas sp. UBA1879]|jgi:formate dehydrogenase subunit delta|uniref:formate dehydrogenase subunit delta n=1 Tax=Pseudomonas sp. UBA1879 TaxID=1947305 RepID=UPI0025F50445|nr:formate dehydrogenase subunit delta [Pseudomonas sp. UBA1879]
MSDANLIKMANQIAKYFATEPDPQAAVLGVRNHIQMFWTPGMKKELVALQAANQAADLHPLAQDAVRGAGW